MSWLAIRENETGAGMGNEISTALHVAGCGAIRHMRCQQPRGRNCEHSFQVGGRFGPVGRAQEVEGHLPFDYSIRLGQGRIS